jgi:hypothetical protein
MHCGIWDEEQALLAVRSLLSSLASNPQLLVSAFFSGFVLELLQGQSEILEQLSHFIKNGQLEHLAGFHFEAPACALLPEEALRQVERSRAWWKEQKLPLPRGIWLSSVTESQLAVIQESFSFDYALMSENMLYPNGEDSPDCGMLSIGLTSIPVFPLASSNASTDDFESQAEPELISRLISSLPRSKSFSIVSSVIEALGVMLDPFSRSSGPHLLEHFFEQVLSLEFIELSTPAKALEALDYAKHSLTLTNPQTASLPESAEVAWLSLRRTEIRRLLASAAESISLTPNFAVNTERLKTALSWLDRSFFVPRGRTYHARFAETYHALLQAQVSLDAIGHSEIDPRDGWIELNPGEQTPENSGCDWILDNPFLRLYFSTQASGIKAIDYKPRKIQLLPLNPKFLSFRGAVLKTIEESPPFTPELLSPPLGPEFRVIMKSPSLIRARLSEKLRSPLADPTSETALLNKDFTVRAGLGAFLQDATTGFSLEYWLENCTWNDKDSLNLALAWHIYLPSGEQESLSARPLLCVGAQAEQTVSLASSVRLDSSAFPGGLHGVRLIDGVQGYTIDFRSAKKLGHIYLLSEDPDNLQKSALNTPLPHYLGTTVVFSSALADVSASDRTNTIFVSTG